MHKGMGNEAVIVSGDSLRIWFAHHNSQLSTPIVIQVNIQTCFDLICLITNKTNGDARSGHSKVSGNFDHLFLKKGWCLIEFLEKAPSTPQSIAVLCQDRHARDQCARISLKNSFPGPARF